MTDLNYGSNREQLNGLIKDMRRWVDSHPNMHKYDTVGQFLDWVDIALVLARIDELETELDNCKEAL